MSVSADTAHLRPVDEQLGGFHVPRRNMVGAGIAAPADLAAPSALRVRNADLSRATPIEWAWRRRLPIGSLSLLLGAEGMGKGTLIAWLLARISRGELPGDLEGQPARALVVGDEDGFDNVTVPRLAVAGADLNMIDTIHEADDEIDLRRDADALHELIAAEGYRLVIFDALLDVLGVDTDDWRAKGVRDALRPLRRAARDLGFAAVGALHPNKGQRSNFRDSVSGSFAFNAASRSSLFLATHPDDDERRVLVRGKGNLSQAPPSFDFALEGRDLIVADKSRSFPTVIDPHEGSLTVDDLLRPQREAPVRDTLAEQIDELGTGEIQTRAEISKALGRSADDRSVGRALDQLEGDGQWEKVGRGQWKKVSGFGIGTYREVPMSRGGAGAGNVSESPLVEGGPDRDRLGAQLEVDAADGDVPARG